MLYVSTKNFTNRFSPDDTLHTHRAFDGGAFVPEVLPSYSKADIFRLKKKSFAESVAFILNVFFEKDLNAWDVEFSVGRYPYRVTPMHHRVFMGEVCNNLASTYEYFEKGLFDQLSGNNDPETKPTYWAKVAIQIAVLFGLFGELLRRDVYEADLSVSAEEFISPVAAWYARSMGLPVKKIICATGNNHVFWDLIHRGECSTAAFTTKPDLYAGIESLLYGVYGAGEVDRFKNCANQRCIYTLPDGIRDLFVEQYYVSVPSEDRVTATIRSLYQIHGYYASPMAAQVFSGLQDYRARTGESRNALLLSLSSPVFYIERLSSILGYTPQEIEALIKKA